MRKIVFHLLLILVPSALVLGCLELAARFYLANLAQVRVNYEVARNFVDKPQIFRDYDNDYLVSDFFPTRYYSDEDDLRGRMIRRHKTKDTYRIFSFGGSSTAGSPFGHWASYSRFLEDYLDKNKPSHITDVEMVNFGVSGFGTGRVVELVSDLIEYDPDLILLYSGHNEHCEHYELIRQLSESSFGYTLAERLNSVKAGVHIFNRLQQPASPPEPFKAEACRKKYSLPLTSLTTKVLDSQYEQNIELLVELAASSAADLVLVSQLANEVSPPGYSVDSSPGYALEVELMDSINTQAVSKMMAVVDSLREQDPDSPWIPYGEAAHKLTLHTKTDSITELLEDAIQKDRSARRFRNTYRSILKKVAAKNERVHFVDAKVYAERFIEDKVIDGRFMVDLHHPTITGQRIIADAILLEYFSNTQFSRNQLSAIDFDAPRWPLPKEIDRYSKVCERYLRISDWSACLAEYQDRINKGNPVLEARRLMGVKEHVFIRQVLQSEAAADQGDSFYGQFWMVP